MSEPLRPRNPFRTVTFGGYHREDVDGYLADAQRLAKRLEDEIDALKTQLERARAEREAMEQEHALALSQSNAERDDLVTRLRATRDELDRTKIELQRALERAEQLQAERDNFQRLAERLAAEEQQTRDVLRAATKAADELKADAKREALEIVQRAESTAHRIESEAHRRVEDIRKEYERARKEYDEFLRQARDVTEGLVRKLDEARSKWPG